MKLATEVRWQSRNFDLPIERIKLTEELGFDAVFTAEGMGSDAISPLGYLAAVTNKLILGTHVCTVTARPPTTLGQAFQTIDAMAGGNRVLVGLGNGQPSLSEGWHGLPWGNPVNRMRDYVDVMRQVFVGDGPHDVDGADIEWPAMYQEYARARLRNPVTLQSPQYSIPYRGPGAKNVHPWVSLLEGGAAPPVLLAAIGPQMITLTAEIADGWFPMGFAPGMMKAYAPLLQAGFDKAGGGKSYDKFDIWTYADTLVIDDVGAGLRLFSEYVVDNAPFMRFQMETLGYEGLSERLHQLVKEGSRDQAILEVPDEFVDNMFLVGPCERIAERTRRWIDSGSTGMIFRYGLQSRVGHGGHIKEDLRVYEAVAKSVKKYS